MTDAVMHRPAFGVQQTTHPTKPDDLGKPIGSAAMEALIDQPGPIELKTVVGADWTADLSGLLNLNDPKAVRGPARHLVDHQIGRSALKGIFMTHLHLDHISGMPDVPNDVPIYTGPGEPEYSNFENTFVQGMEDSFFDGRPALQEFQFSKDPDGKLDGVIDVFGDGSFFAILSPGHTPGSVAFVARTTTGTVLLTGDSCAIWRPREYPVETAVLSSSISLSRKPLARTNGSRGGRGMLQFERRGDEGRSPVPQAGLRRRDGLGSAT